MLSTPAKLIQSFLPGVVAIVVALQIMNSPEKNWAGTRRKVFKATLVEEVVDDNKKVVGFCLIFRTFCIMRQSSGPANPLLSQNKNSATNIL